MPDAKEAVRQDVLEKAVEEFLGGQDIRFEPVPVAAVAIAILHLAVLASEDAVVTDRDTMRVASQVIQELAWPGKGSLRIHHPRFLSAVPQPTAAGGSLGQFGQLRRQFQLVAFQQFGQAIQILGTEHLAQPTHRKQELPPPGDPP